MSDAPDPDHFFKQDDDFWLKYAKGRPNIPQSYFDTIFAYHAKHSGNFGVALDGGAGPGIHVPRLLDKFDRVVVTDPFESNISTSKAHLAPYADRCLFKLTTLENTVTTQAPGSVDFVFCQAMWHFTKPDEALAAVAHLLKPGGTFAVSLVGVPVYSDPRVWDIWSRMFRAVIREEMGKRDGVRGSMREPVLALLSNLDSVAVAKSGYFRPGALRLKMRDPLGPGRNFYRESWLPEEFAEDMPHWSEVGPDDIVREEEVTDEWKIRTNYEGLRDIMMTFPNDYESETQVKLWKEMKEVMGDGETEVVFPYSLVLATRR